MSVVQSSVIEPINPEGSSPTIIPHFEHINWYHDQWSSRYSLRIYKASILYILLYFYSFSVYMHSLGIKEGIAFIQH